MKVSIEQKVQSLEKQIDNELALINEDIKHLDYNISKIKEVQQSIKNLKEYYDHEPFKIMEAILGNGDFNILEKFAIKVLSRRF